MSLPSATRRLMSRFAGRGPWPPARRDWLVAGGWLAGCAADIALENENGMSFTHPDPTPPLTWVFLIAFVALLLGRRRVPLLTLIGGYAVMTAAAASGAHLDKGFVPVAMVAYLAFCAARVAPGPRDVAVVLGVGVAGVLAVMTVFLGSQGVGDFLWGSVMVNVLPVAAARAFRHHEHLHELLQERAAQLEDQRDERARLAAAQERERIAGELHDVVAHGVSAMVVQAAAARRLVAARGDTEEAHAAIADVEASGRAALDELRRLLGVLRRGDEGLALAPQPSMARVDRLVSRLRAEGLPVGLEVEGEPAALPPGLDVTAYRIVEEALTDVLRTEGAESANVRVRYGARELELEVTDEAGAGRGAARDRDERFGLRERVALFGGELHAGRRRGGAWSLQARLPIDRDLA